MKLTAYSRSIKINQEKMIHIYEVTLMTSQGCNNFQLFNLGKITRNYYTPGACDHATSIIKRSERHIIIEIKKLLIIIITVMIIINNSNL